MGRWGDGISRLSRRSLSLSFTKTVNWLHKKPWGMFFGVEKNPCGNGDTHSLDFNHRIGVFSYGKTLGRVFGGHKKPLREWGHALPGFGQVPVSNPGLEPGSSRVRRPRASPLGNLTTVGHFAKVSLGLTLHFHRFSTQSSIKEKTVF